MALFKITVKVSQNLNGIRIEKGTSVELSSKYGNPISTNGGHEVIYAFERKYGIDLKKVNSVSSNYLELEKM